MSSIARSVWRFSAGLYNKAVRAVHLTQAQRKPSMPSLGHIQPGKFVRLAIHVRHYRFCFQMRSRHPPRRSFYTTFGVQQSRKDRCNSKQLTFYATGLRTKSVGTLREMLPLHERALARLEVVIYSISPAVLPPPARLAKAPSPQEPQSTIHSPFDSSFTSVQHGSASTEHGRPLYHYSWEVVPRMRQVYASAVASARPRVHGAG